MYPALSAQLLQRVYCSHCCNVDQQPVLQEKS
jgi:hypothetical protein